MKRRLLWSYLSITAFVLLVLEIPLGVSYSNSVERRLTSDAQHEAFAVAIRTQGPLERVATDARAAARLRALAHETQARTGGRVVIVDTTGRAVGDSDVVDDDAPLRDYASRPEIEAALTGRQVSGVRSSHTLDAALLYVAVPVGTSEGIQGAVRVTYPASVVDDRIREIWLLLAATGGVVLGIVFLVSQLLARSITRPLDELRDASLQLGAGDLSVRAEVPRGPAELTELATSFNATAARLEQLVTAQRGFVADASHQLRTPLAALRLRLEILEADVDGPIADDLDGALAEVERLSRLVDALLALARAEQAPSDPVAVSLAEVVAGRREAWDAFAAERHVHVVADLRGAPYALVTPGRLEQVLDNLLNNALEVAPAGSAVRIATTVISPDSVQLVVSDEGPGMSDEERARAFDRFWQSSGARRGRPSGHFGLGLAIVRQLVTSDGGTISLGPVPEGSGLRVTVRMRRAPTPSGADSDARELQLSRASG
jgi:signal transduction histidine kinase